MARRDAPIVIRNYEITPQRQERPPFPPSLFDFASTLVSAQSKGGFLMQSQAIHNAAPSARPIEVVNAAYEAYGRKDLAAIAALYHPDCELYQSELLPWGGSYRGHAGLQLFFERLTGAIDTQIVGETLFEAGDQVVSIGRTRGMARATHARFELPAVHVYTVKDGTIRRYEAFVDTPGMLHAIGRQA
jgi:hypothetical protein